jgi:hypothetical protein
MTGLFLLLKDIGSKFNLLNNKCRGVLHISVTYFSVIASVYTFNAQIRYIFA